MARAARRRRLGGAIVALTAAAALAVPAAASAPTIVPVGDNFFGHDGHVHGVGATRGTVVRWIWTGRRRHNVTVVSGPRRFHSRTQRRGTFEHRMTRAGRYTLVCTIHGRRDQSMTLMVR
jgi:plastocyanin